MRSLVKQGILAILLGICLILQSGCGKSERDEPTIPSNSSHSYDINIASGEAFSGQIPKETAGVYNSVSFVNYDPEQERKTITILLQEAGKTQVTVGLILDHDNQPASLIKNGEEISSKVTVNKWGEELRYTSVQCTFSLKAYQEHSITAFGDEATVAALSLEFEGFFQASTSGEEVEVSGAIKIAAP
ncbi:hypothetical protein SAMN04489724_0266 [Algoriphagus locisalis]|uniref:Uncharacterized protein n=1 Tax=Algoriphagus locisalis TaxID=305507 RepID=A0A1I7E8D6_9BACT|nr:hypothetical protein [Algoriphagus locisalis]SFU20197.1 hypothetical protein SAMN04489724_0266 [Algoriphagus locisalis]